MSIHKSEIMGKANVLLRFAQGLEQAMVEGWDDDETMLTPRAVDDLRHKLTESRKRGWSSTKCGGSISPMTSKTTSTLPSMKLSQASRLLALLKDGQPHSTVEIMERVYGGSHLGLARVGARIYDLKNKGHEIRGWKDEKNPAVYWYQMKVKPKLVPMKVVVDGVEMVRFVPQTAP
jgi:hypothetical protein